MTDKFQSIVIKSASGVISLAPINLVKAVRVRFMYTQIEFKNGRTIYIDNAELDKDIYQYLFEYLGGADAI